MKLHNYQTFFYCLLLLILSARSFAELSDNNIQDHIVTFSPGIYIGDDFQLCLGVRLSAEILLTSPECVRLISKQYNADITVDVLNRQKRPQGKVRLLGRTESKKGLLGIDAQNEGQKIHRTYPALRHRPLDILTAVEGVYLRPVDAAIQTVPSIVNHQRSDTHHYYTLNSRDPLPAGSPMVHEGKIVCVVSADGTCRAPVMDKKTLSRIKVDCRSLLPDFYFYSGCVNRTITHCSYDLGSVDGKGTCINSQSQENCQFTTSESYSTESIAFTDSITCPSCSADFFGDTEEPYPSDICKPSMCIKGCISQSRSNNNTEKTNALRLQNNTMSFKVMESCSQCLSEEQQMFNSCSQICQSGMSYPACKACFRAVQEKEKECQQICSGN
ncbi:hypothetical protein [Endozoicomonas sp. ISHI1]|uniref:hypothetical protein n=1 Tax=Endozoicomonas sp. ISHI1 TaxID=2825882 RepID=UPI002148F829|nr:hypothetical protein [Endozoicomonas sp. ISHI1]